MEKNLNFDLVVPLVMVLWFCDVGYLWEGKNVKFDLVVPLVIVIGVVSVVSFLFLLK